MRNETGVISETSEYTVSSTRSENETAGRTKDDMGELKRQREREMGSKSERTDRRDTECRPHQAELPRNQERDRNRGYDWICIPASSCARAGLCVF
jgi:hypothetical protein